MVGMNETVPHNLLRMVLVLAVETFPNKCPSMGHSMAGARCLEDMDLPF